MLLEKVTEEVRSGNSGAITVHEIVSRYGTRSVTRETLLEWAENYLPAGSFEKWNYKVTKDTLITFNEDKGVITPTCPQAWEILEGLYGTMPNHKFDVNTQDAAYSIANFRGWLPEGIDHDWSAIAQEQARARLHNKLCGYGSERHGGCAS